MTQVVLLVPKFRSATRTISIAVLLSLLVVGSNIFGVAATATDIATDVSTASETEHALHLRRGAVQSNNNKDNDNDNEDDNEDVKELYITQELDHFDGTNDSTFQQRYFVSYRHGLGDATTGTTADSNSNVTSNSDTVQEQLPIVSLLCVGGEGPGFEKSVLIDSVHCSGDMLELAKRIAQMNTHQVRLYALEHRYYGKSYPIFGNETSSPSPLAVENLRFLSSRQALEDLAHFVHTVNKETSTDDNANTMNTWVTFGGSYPGLVSMYARYKYPHLIFASVSSSAPLQLRVDFPGYKAKQGWGLKYDKIGGSDECYRIVKAGHRQAVTLLQQQIGNNNENNNNKNESGAVALAKKFGVCKPETALSKRRNQELLLGDGLINIMSQNNDPSCTGGELCNIDGLCRFMIREMDEMKANAKANKSASSNSSSIELEVLAKVSQKQRSERELERELGRGISGKEKYQGMTTTTKRYAVRGDGVGENDSNCVDVDFDAMVEYFSGLEIKPSGDRSWLWQTCTEFGFYQTCGEDDNCPFASHFHNIDSDLEICARLFNITSDRVYQNVQSSLDLYGGKEFLDSGAASRILTVNGNVDPWSALGLEEDSSSSTISSTSTSSDGNAATTIVHNNYLLPVKMVDGASHHFWTHAIKDTDALEILKIREYIYSCVMSWLGIPTTATNTTTTA
uniref:Thymus-specific serine protease n=1 Tax=Pseudo-nitzschia australis TaxID=44445 RepID=A0A7S4EPT6_9STRA|mmetsp:Transcript_17723/g.38718  ORF Transcript_17723/g.38718 Transcript_17723/m.38718 type:complete len:682 (-) Transcript_17723:98-2143(-)|eukprot:CAMPEP_0168197250 /NCGR_PEP_ID=MMETSP0139_2-20121125/21030_1 /TAXON_ID=44445 /ORGANISM="Pseudo-nitzschia australis, Strain 10249 10 AB" /LENGTH=681 /DNA_ID=CAMNT_0008121641 /DNA_START=21 /DNA_END=2062 /DNA_ORIENTATION=+